MIFSFSFLVLSFTASQLVDGVSYCLSHKFLLNFPLQFIVTYVENMLRLESGAIGEFIGSTMLLAIVDRLVDLDVSLYIFVRYFI